MYGRKVVKTSSANFAVAEPPLKLVLLENPGSGGTLNHLGVEVEDTAAVDAGQRRVAESGLASADERSTTCCYAQQDKFWVQGAPDGERWQVYTVLGDNPTFGADRGATDGGPRRCLLLNPAPEALTTVLTGGLQPCHRPLTHLPAGATTALASPVEAPTGAREGTGQMAVSAAPPVPAPPPAAPSSPSAPAAAEPLLGDSRTTRGLLLALRLGIALLWIENTGWKRPPNFSALRTYTQDAVDRPVFGPYAYVVQHVVLPHFQLFAWGTLVVEMLLGIFLLLGLATRFWAVVGFAQVIAITLAALNAPGEWEWSYYLMLLAHVAIFATAPGRVLGLDGLLRPRWRASDTRLTRLLVRAS